MHDLAGAVIVREVELEDLDAGKEGASVWIPAAFVRYFPRPTSSVRSSSQTVSPPSASAGA